MATLLDLIDQTITLVSSPKSRHLEFADVMKEIPTIDLEPLINRSKDITAVQSVCKQIVGSLHKYGILIVKDNRLTTEKSNKFINMMEDYFNRTESEKMKDVFPDLHYQVGATPQLTEIPRNHCDKIQTLDPTHRPLTPCPPEADPKWRFFWKLNKKKTENVIPSNMRNFESLCDSTGDDLLNAAYIIAEGIAMGLGLNRSYFRSRMDGASNLLAPTATDLNKYGAKGTIIAGYHYDLNLLTVHGKSRYEGLYIWLRDGRKVKVKIPDGYLVCQAAKQLEWVTGGYIFAGYHEVVVDDGTLKCMRKWKKLNRPLWRISMTMFSHFRSDVKLEIIRQFKTAELVQKYPPITTYDQVMQELKKIGLAANNS